MLTTCRMVGMNNKSTQMAQFERIANDIRRFFEIMEELHNEPVYDGYTVITEDFLC